MELAEVGRGGAAEASRFAEGRQAAGTWRGTGCKREEEEEEEEEEWKEGRVVCGALEARRGIRRLKRVVAVAKMWAGVTSRCL